MSVDILDLEEVVETWAWKSYKKTHSDKALKLEDIRMDINWSAVSFVTEKPTYSQPVIVKPISQVIFKSVFCNESDTPQSHSLKTERQTTATCTSSLTKGCTKGFNVGLTLAAPGDVAKASVGFEKGFSIENAKETSDQKTLTWAAEGSLTVKPKSTLTAELQITEKQCTYTFSSKVAINGRVTVSIYNKKENNNFIMSVMGDIKEILVVENKISNIKQNDKTAYIALDGKCEFRFGIEQQLRCYCGE
jgi:hypothetical protein